VCQEGFFYREIIFSLTPSSNFFLQPLPSNNVSTPNSLWVPFPSFGDILDNICAYSTVISLSCYFIFDCWTAMFFLMLVVPWISLPIFWLWSNLFFLDHKTLLNETLICIFDVQLVVFDVWIKKLRWYCDTNKLKYNFDVDLFFSASLFLWSYQSLLLYFH